jgi:DNA-binding NarL/FixJ family response regulator
MIGRKRDLLDLGHRFDVSDSAPIRVLLADDDDIVRAGLRLILEADDAFTVVGEATNGREAVTLATEVRPDVALIDIRMPEMDGIEATRAIVATEPNPPRVVILTTFDVKDYIHEALRAGASGFLLKRTAPDDLKAAIRTVHEGDALLSPSVTRMLLDEFAKAAPTGEHLDRPLDELTDREIEVLTEIGRGLSNAEIADALYVSENTVKTHIKHVLMKLDLRGRVAAVIYAYDAGLVTPHTPHLDDD